MIFNEEILLSDLLKVFEEKHYRNIFIVNREKYLIGSISQGDILRALKNGVSIKSKAIDCAQLNPITLNKEPETYQDLLDLLVSNQIQSVPIVDSEKRIIKVITIYDVLNAIREEDGD